MTFINFPYDTYRSLCPPSQMLRGAADVLPRKQQLNKFDRCWARFIVACTYWISQFSLMWENWENDFIFVAQGNLIHFPRIGKLSQNVKSARFGWFRGSKIGPPKTGEKLGKFPWFGKLSQIWENKFSSISEKSGHFPIILSESSTTMIFLIWWSKPNSWTYLK